MASIRHQLSIAAPAAVVYALQNLKQVVESQRNRNGEREVR